MRHLSARSGLISVAAIIGAMIWGAAEFLALQCSRVTERSRVASRIRAR